MRITFQLFALAFGVAFALFSVLMRWGPAEPAAAGAPKVEVVYEQVGGSGVGGTASLQAQADGSVLAIVTATGIEAPITGQGTFFAMAQNSSGGACDPRPEPATFGRYEAILDPLTDGEAFIGDVDAQLVEGAAMEALFISQSGGGPTAAGRIFAVSVVELLDDGVFPFTVQTVACAVLPEGWWWGAIDVGPPTGDVDCSRAIDVIDALFMLQSTANLLPRSQCISLGDVDCDGTIGSLDALGVLFYVADLPALSVQVPCATVGCWPWPEEAAQILERLPVEEGLCLRRFADTSEFPASQGCARAGACYASPEVWYIFAVTVTGELGTLAHEICHAHQARVRQDTKDVETWEATAEGSSFIQVTGWRFEAQRWVAGPPEAGWSGIPSPFEDAAEVCASWFVDREMLQGSAPIRYEWAHEWLPD